MEDEQITKMADEIMEMNDFLEKLKKGEVYTHGTKFHADDVFSTVLINKVADKYDIKRPHVNRIIDAKWAGELSNDYIVYDIGFGKFDHHQKDNEIRENGIPYAAFGKLWRAVGADLVGEHAACRIEQSFVQNIDYTDNTGEPNMLSTIINDFNPNWDDDASFDERFNDAVNYAATAFDLTLSHILSEERAINVVKESPVKEGILILPRYVPWANYVTNNMPEVNFVVFPSDRGGYTLRTVSNPGETTGKILFPEEWLGTVDEEKGRTFCHPGNFLAVFNTKEQAIDAGIEATLAAAVDKIGEDTTTLLP